jgi:hypothetical protein
VAVEARLAIIRTWPHDPDPLLNPKQLGQDYGLSVIVTPSARLDIAFDIDVPAEAVRQVSIGVAGRWLP